MKLCLIVYHKNIFNIYRPEWICTCVKSLLNQSVDFDILELNYGNETKSVFEGYLLDNKLLRFYRIPMEDHSYAMNFLISKAFELGYDIVFNSNLDDYYHPQRFYKQILAVNKGYDLVSSICNYVDENNKFILKLDKSRLGLESCGGFMTLESVYQQIVHHNNNVINHSGVCFTRKFWESYDMNNNLLRYENNKPYEDLILWQRALLSKNIKIGIIDEVLIYYRIHSTQICSGNREDKKFNEYPGISKKRIGIVMVATGKYKMFLQKTIDRIKSNFLPNYSKIFYLFLDQEIEPQPDVVQTIISRRGFPGDTLYRYHYFLIKKNEIIQTTDVVYYFDVDMDIPVPIQEDILPDQQNPLVAVRHPGFYMPSPFSKPYGSPEESPLSTAYIPLEQRVSNYVAGGFNGGITHHFLEMAEEIKKNIDIDDTNEVIASWHDESHLNRYYTTHFNKFKILMPEYCYPEGFEIPFEKRIVALSKDHTFYRLSEKYLTCQFMGGLGNMLFQYATTFATAKRNGFVPIFSNLHPDRNLVNSNKHGKNSYRNSIFSNILRTNTDKLDLKNYRETHYYYTPIEVEQNTKLIGYFQSWKYFDDCKKDIVDSLNIFSTDVDKYHNGIVEFMGENTVSVHVRKGDYCNLYEYHHNLSNLYYEKAVKVFDENCVFVVFSDCIDWCKQMPAFQNLKNVYYVEGLDEVSSLILVSKCKHNIIANSSLSWWGAYLNSNPSKTVVYPRQWFGTKGAEYKLEDMVFDSWIEIEDLEPGLSFIIDCSDDVSTLDICLGGLLGIYDKYPSIEVILACDSKIPGIIDYKRNYPFIKVFNTADVKIKGVSMTNSLLQMTRKYNIVKWKSSLLPIKFTELIDQYKLCSEKLTSKLVVGGLKYNGNVLEQNISHDVEVFYRLGNANQHTIEEVVYYDFVKMELEGNDVKQNNFVFVIPSYECPHYISRCLESIESQTYKNYKVYVIDDASSKEHNDICKKYCKKNSWNVVINKVRKGALYNIINTLEIGEIEDEDIIVLVDGDDWINQNCLEILNLYYQDSTLITYGRYIHYNPDNKVLPGHCYHNFFAPCNDISEQDKKDAKFRNLYFVFHHLRTFNMKLWKQIKIEDLLNVDGKPYSVAWDLAIMYPLLEMARERVKYINFPLYIYNIENPLNDFKNNQKLQSDIALQIKKKKVYPRFDE